MREQQKCCNSTILYRPRSMEPDHCRASLGDLGLYLCQRRGSLHPQRPSRRPGKAVEPGGSVSEGFIALNGEAGFQPDTVRGGFHFFVPFQFRVHKVALVSIPQGQIGYVYARDGVALAPEQTLARNDQANNFENVRDFLAKGGQKGPQRKILREGVYAINLAQFVVLTATRNYSVELAASDDGVLVKPPA